MRRILCILLLLCLPLQGFALPGGFGTSGGAVDVFSHELEHEQDVHHHHDDDGSIHYDDSDESRDHAHEQSSSPQPASFDAPRLPFAPEQLVSGLATDVHSFVPEPFLDGPHRPPASALG